MATQPLPGPGKTAPRLISDLLDYDRRFLKRNGRNLLADPAQHFTGEWILRKGKNDCRHSLTRKDTQMRGPTGREMPNEAPHYVVATYCAKCRHHFKITVSFAAQEHGQKPCSLSDENNRMHHLRLVESMFQPLDKRKLDDHKYEYFAEGHQFRCSGMGCPVVVEILISPPRLDKDDMNRLLDPGLVRARGQKEIENDPVRMENEKPVTAATALGYLRSYINDARNGKLDSKTGKPSRIAMRNKKYRLGFSDEFHDLFRYLDFVNVVDPPTEVEGPLHFWKLPVITDANRDFIEDVYIEICFLLEERPPTEFYSGVKTIIHRPIPALKDIQTSLGCYDYPTRTRSINLEHEEHPYYASLGACDDFTDEYLSWAYDRQCDCDPSNKPYYLDCLEDLARGRQSTDLQTKFAIAQSAGEYGQKRIHEAYRFFLLDPTKPVESEDYILGCFNSFLGSSPRQKNQAKENLKIIANHLSSTKILAAANDNTMTFEEALETLNATADMDSDSIVALAIVAVENVDKDRVARALQVIANSRNGDHVLLMAASNTEHGTGDPSLSVKDAYNRLQINNATFSDDNVLAYYNQLMNDAPAGSKASFTEALKVIAHDRQSIYLLRKLADPNAEIQTSTAEPVGLDNIGNTCYLNSLLQYYYTVKQIRDTVMDFPNHRMELNDETIKMKRVGGRQVEKAEIIKAQKFVEELHSLFVNLRTAPARSVKPSRQLAELTIFSSEAVRTFRSYSISSPQGPPNISEIMAGPVYGPELPPPPTRRSTISSTSFKLPPAAGEDVEMKDQSNARDDSSEATLVDDPPSYDETDKDQDKAHFPTDNKTPQDPSLEVVQLEADAVMVNGSHTDAEASNQVAENPPPIPPRNKSGLVISTGESIPSDDELWRFGTQQDVTEVIGNVMFRLQCAIKPTAIEEGSGEQLDVIRNTFFGTNTVYTQKPQTLEMKVEAWPTLIVFPAKNTERDIYEALDVVFDEQEVEIDNITVPQYSSISKLPPILQIQIQRTDFDPETQRGSKNRQQVKFLESLYLDRYVDSDPDSYLMKRRREAWKWKKHLRKLEARYAALQNEGSKLGLSVPEALVATKAFLTELQGENLADVPVSPELLEMMDERIAEVSAEREQRASQIADLEKKLKDQFTDMREFEYKLHAVFIHRGEAGGGHYWIYIYDFEHDIWREYNDDRVEEVRDRNRIFSPSQADFGLAGTPYYLVYVRSSDRKDFVDPISRDVVEIQMEEMNMGMEMDGLPAPVGDDDDDATMTNGVGVDLGVKEPEVYHIEHANPRPLRPKMPANPPSWEDVKIGRVDANGRPW